LNQEAEDRAKALHGTEVEDDIVTLIRGEDKHKGAGFLRVPSHCRIPVFKSVPCRLVTSDQTDTTTIAASRPFQLENR
jgi:hypothetical protein